MKIRAKVCCSLIALFIPSFLLMAFAARHFVIRETVDLERQFLTDTANHARALVNSQIQWLSGYARDMSFWDRTYSLMNSDREFARSYFDEDLPNPSLGIDAILFFHEDGTLFHNQMLGEGERSQPFLEELEATLGESLSHRRETPKHQSAGLLNLPSGSVIMMAMSPILTSDGKGPSRGTLVLAQRFAQEEGAEIEHLAGLEMDLQPLTEARKDPALVPIINGLVPDKPLEIQDKGPVPRGYAQVEDMNGNPALLLALPFPEDLLKRHRESLLLWALGMGSAFLLLLASTFLLLQRVILDRLIKMATNLEPLALSPTSDERLPVESSDEITSVTLHFNRLMDSVKEKHERLLQSEIRYRTIFEQSPVSLWEEDFSAIIEHLDELRTAGVEDLGHHFEEHQESLREICALPRVLDINSKALEILRAESKEELLENLSSVFRDEALQLIKQEILAIANGDQNFEGEGILYALDDRRLYVHVRWTSVPERNSFERVLLSIEDITERKNIEDRLRLLSLHDPLTGVNNRNFFKEQITRLESGRFDPLGLVSLDLDGLKLANDFMGHQAGDELLSRTGHLLKSVFRESDLIARIGGDEFAILLPRCSFTGLEKALERLKEELAHENDNRPGPVPLSFSVGWDWREKGEPSITQMLINADRRMYRQKRESRRERLERLRKDIGEGAAEGDPSLEEHNERLHSILEILQERENGLDRNA